MASHRQQQISRVEFWNSIKPDPNYIPGLGRGAQGFTTRSDIGPSKFTPTVSQSVRILLACNTQGPNTTKSCCGILRLSGCALASVAGPHGHPPHSGQDPSSQLTEGPIQAPKEEDPAAHQEFDQFLGNDAGAFAYGDYDEEDKEADEVYAQIEAVMDERRKVCFTTVLSWRSQLPPGGDMQTAACLALTEHCHCIANGHPCSHLQQQTSSALILVLHSWLYRWLHPPEGPRAFGTCIWLVHCIPQQFFLQLPAATSSPLCHRLPHLTTGARHSSTWRLILLTASHPRPEALGLTAANSHRRASLVLLATTVLGADWPVLWLLPHSSCSVWEMTGR